MAAATTTGPDTVSDEALVGLAQNDPASFAPLYERYVDPVFRYCFRKLGTKPSAEDATGQTFERALAALPNYRSQSFRAWLFAIARNTVTDMRRRQHNTDTQFPDQFSMHDTSPGPEEAAVARSESAALRRALKQLSPEQEKIVQLRLAGLTCIEIAETLGRSPGSVRTAQYRALLRL